MADLQPNRIIFHIDVNSAFLSWTAVERLRQGDTLDLRTVPSIIGGDESTRHGIVLAKSVPAKAFGIQTAEPVAAALKKCPDLVVASPDHALYKRESAKFMDFLSTITTDLEQLSIDETYLDFTPIAPLYDSYMDCAWYIKEEIHKRFGFTVNIGIAPNRLLAKMASDFTKPDRIHTLFLDEVPSKMWPLPVDDLYMTGHSSAARLHELGFHTIGDLAHADPAILEAHFKSHGRQMWNYANGIASDRLNLEPRDAKGIGNSTTMSHDVTSHKEALEILRRLCEKVSERLQKHHFLAGSVTVEIKYADFTSRSHQKILLSPTATVESLHTAIMELFDELWDEAPIRLLGVRTGKLTDENAPVQMNLFDWQQDLAEHNARTAAENEALEKAKLAAQAAAKAAAERRQREEKLNQKYDAVNEALAKLSLKPGAGKVSRGFRKTTGTGSSVSS